MPRRSVVRDGRCRGKPSPSPSTSPAGCAGDPSKMRRGSCPKAKRGGWRASTHDGPSTPPEGGPVLHQAVVDDDDVLQTVPGQVGQVDPRIGEVHVGETSGCRRSTTAVWTQPHRRSLKNHSSRAPVRTASVTPSPSRSTRRTAGPPARSSVYARRGRTSAGPTTLAAEREVARYLAAWVLEGLHRAHRRCDPLGAGLAVGYVRR